MPIVRDMSRSETDHPVVKAVYDRFFGDRDPSKEPGVAPERGGTPGTYWTTTALAPEILEWVEHGLGIFLTGNESYENGPALRLNPQLREFGIVRAGWARGSQFVFSQHSKALRMTGVSEEKVAAVPYWQTADCYTPAERAVLAYTDGLVLSGGRIPDQHVAELKKHLSDEEIVELTYAATLWEMFATICKALRVEWDDRPDPIVEIDAPKEMAQFNLGR
jgi:alkylhydroperoxidase family enzyme